MLKVTKIKKKIFILTLAFFSAVIAFYALNEGQPFLSLYNNYSINDNLPIVPLYDIINFKNTNFHVYPYVDGFDLQKDRGSKIDYYNI